MEYFHYSNVHEIKKDHSYEQDNQWFKPIGLWYSINNSWAVWCNSNDYELGNNRFQLEIDYQNILIIDSKEKLQKFQDKYYNPIIENISWKRVASDYHGIEIKDFHSIKYSFYKESQILPMWFYGLDCDSGCIWNFNAIKSIVKI